MAPASAALIAVAIDKAVTEAIKGIRRLGESAVKASGDLVSALTSARVGAADFVESLGVGTKKAADALFAIAPATGVFKQFVQVAGAAVGVFGQMIESVGQVMHQFDAMAGRYVGFGPGLAQAQAQAAVTHVMGEFRRGQEVGPQLAKYVEARTELQEKWEDVKAKFIARITPAVVTIVNMIEEFMPLIGDVSDSLAQLINFVVEILKHFKLAVDKQDKKDAKKPPVNLPGLHLAQMHLPPF